MLTVTHTVFTTKQAMSDARVSLRHLQHLRWASSLSLYRAKQGTESSASEWPGLI